MWLNKVTYLLTYLVLKKPWRRVGAQKPLDFSEKKTGTRPTDFLVFLIACFIPPKCNRSVKTISISADIAGLLSFKDVYFQPS